MPRSTYKILSLLTSLVDLDFEVYPKRESYWSQEHQEKLLQIEHLVFMVQRPGVIYQNP